MFRKLCVKLARESRQSQPEVSIRLVAHRTERRVFWLFFTPEVRDAKPMNLMTERRPS